MEKRVFECRGLPITISSLDLQIFFIPDSFLSVNAKAK